MSKIKKVEEFESTSKASTFEQENHAEWLPARVIQSADLFGAENEVGIIHEGAMYRLRVTRAGKLILNK